MATVVVVVAGIRTYSPVAVLRGFAGDTMWPVPAGERWVFRPTVAWLVLMAVVVTAMTLHVVDSLIRHRAP